MFLNINAMLEFHLVKKISCHGITAHKVLKQRYLHSRLDHFRIYGRQLYLVGSYGVSVVAFATDKLDTI